MTVRERKQQLRARAVVGTAIVLVIGGMVISGIVKREAGKESEMIAATEDVNRFDMEEVEVEEQVTVQPNDLENFRFYDVPLSEELQFCVFKECDGYSFWPNIALAIMDVESDFDIDAVSPKGAVGLMQVVEMYHEERMELLGCDDLYDPYQNIRVGMHYLAELWNEKQDISWVLMAYRHGRTEAYLMYNRGIVDEYALEVMARAAELQLEMEDKYDGNTGIVDCTERSDEFGESD